MADRINISATADEALSAVRKSTGIEFAAVARLALALSLKTAGTNVPRSQDFSGREIRWLSIFGDDASVYRGVVHLVYGRHIDEDEFLSNRSLVKDHIDHGCQLLLGLFRDCDGDQSRFLSRLAGESAVSPPASGTDGIDLLVGTHALSGDEVVFRLNDMAAHANPHVGIAGKSGTGKTQLLLKMLADLRVQTDYRTGFVVFDYKGDISSNQPFVEVTRARTYHLPDQPLPVSPFVLGDYAEPTVLLSARENAESFGSVSPGFGTVQRGYLSQAVLEAYRRRASQERPYPDFIEVFEIVRERYEAEGKADDTLVEVLRDLSQFRLFWDHERGDAPLESVMGEAIIVDLHRLPVLKELVAYLVIERLYKEMCALADSAVWGGRRQLRTVLVIDEAHNYLPQRNLFLQQVVREGRSKGVAVFLASQSPGDFVQKGFDFKELLEFFITFQSDGLTAAEVQELLGCSLKTARDLPAIVARLKPFEAVSRDMTGAPGVLRFTANSFFQAYG